jgi:hypothetical protein
MLDQQRARLIGMGFGGRRQRRQIGLGQRRFGCCSDAPAAQGAQHVLGAFGQRGALPDQIIATVAPRVERRARHCENLAPLLAGEAR